MPKHKFASVSLAMRDTVISSKFLIHRVSQQSTLANFVQVLEQNSCFPLGGHYTCQFVLFLVLCYVASLIMKCMATSHITSHLDKIQSKLFCVIHKKQTDKEIDAITITLPPFNELMDAWIMTCYR